MIFPIVMVVVVMLPIQPFSTSGTNIPIAEIVLKACGDRTWATAGTIHIFLIAHIRIPLPHLVCAL
nr:MAG TPA: hypothetical protein [Caudoviricetes sp.]